VFIEYYCGIHTAAWDVGAELFCIHKVAPTSKGEFKVCAEGLFLVVHVYLYFLWARSETACLVERKNKIGMILERLFISRKVAP